MPTSTFGNSSSSHEDSKKIDTSPFIQKPYLGTNYMESNIEENIDMQSQNKSKNLEDPLSIREAATKNLVDFRFLFQM